jgi:hypothetical protein
MAEFLMPYDLPLPKAQKLAGWKVKLHDFERLEEPHATIYRKMRKWRLSLRSACFLDSGDKWNQIDAKVKECVESAWKTLQVEWDGIHPDNPVRGGEGNDDDDDD